MPAKRTSLPSLLGEIITPSLRELGFEYRTLRAGVWAFVRTPAPEFEQHITIYRDPHSANTLHCQYGTTDVQVLESAGSFSEQRHPLGWQYSDEESLRVVLSDLLRVTLLYGIPALEQRGGPFLKPPESEGRRLLANPQEWSKWMLDHAGLESLHAEGLDRIEKIIADRRETGQPPDWDLLIGAAAYMGELIRHALGGEWAWAQYRPTPAIVHDSMRYGHIHPLIQVSRYWSGGAPHSIRLYYDRLVR